MIQQPDPQTWDDFLCAESGHLLQSAGWGELKTLFGWRAQRLALERQGRLVAGAQILFRRLPLGLKLAYIPRGPVADPTDNATLNALLDALCAAARHQSAFALKIEPNWHLPPLYKTGAPPSLPRFSFSGEGVQPRTTIHVDLTRELDAILAGMKPKWRYNIRLAERKGVTVRVGSAADVEVFYELLCITGTRDQFAIHSLDYYRAAFEMLGGHARLFIAEYEGEPLAAIFCTAFAGEAIYLYGASSNAHRERMPNHALHWAAMQWAKGCGCTRYDLWGIPDVGAQHAAPLPDSLYQFKQGFGGEVVRYVGAYDIVFSSLKFALYKQALKIRRGGILAS